MSPEQLIDEGIRTGNMELVQKGRALQMGDTATVPIVAKKKRGRPKKVKVENVNIESVESFIDRLNRLEKERLAQVIAEGGGKVKPTNIVLDDASLFTKDAADDKKMQARLVKTPPRPEVRFVKKVCPNCQQTIEIQEDTVHLYSWNPSNPDDEKTMYKCENCLR